MTLQYFYSGHLRWSFFWENPNGFAAFLACLLVWIWWAQTAWRGNPWRRKPAIAGILVLYAFECAIWFLLVKTYSRGGLVAALCAMLLFFFVHGFSVMQRSWCVRHVAVRLIVVGVLCFAVGFAGRLDPEHLVQDKSVLNRLDLWQGALVMINDSPFHGWGHGHGGISYVNWYQSLDAAVRPAGFVNSYLEVAVEHGIHVLFIVLACACVLIVAAIRQRERAWVAGAGTCLTAWGLCNVWSTLWNEPLLWMLPGGSALLVLVASVRYRMPIKVVFMAAGVALLITTALPVGGWTLSKDRNLRVTPLAHAGAVLLTGRHVPKSTEPVCELWTDGIVFGRFFGRTIRSLIQENIEGSLLVYAPGAANAIDGRPRAGRRIYSGFQAGRITDEEVLGSRVVILHPTVFPPASAFMNEKRRLTVCLPQFDALGYDLAWRRWVDGTGVPMVYSPSTERRFHTDSESLRFWHSLFGNE